MPTSVDYVVIERGGLPPLYSPFTANLNPGDNITFTVMFTTELQSSSIVPLRMV